MDQTVSIGLRELDGIRDALEAECWASQLVSTLSRRELVGADTEGAFVPAFVRALERRSSLKALAAAGAERGRQRVAP